MFDVCISTDFRGISNTKRSSKEQMSSETRQKSILPCSSDAIMSALRGLLAEIRAQQHSSLRLHFRRIATSNSPGLGSSEFRVPVPWGFIAGQEWGEELSSSSKPPWIVLHGWLDNSGSFNGLAPLFRERGHRLLCIDLPGTAANNLFCFIDWLIT